MLMFTPISNNDIYSDDDPSGLRLMVRAWIEVADTLKACAENTDMRRGGELVASEDTGNPVIAVRGTPGLRLVFTVDHDVAVLSVTPWIGAFEGAVATSAQVVRSGREDVLVRAPLHPAETMSVAAFVQVVVAGWCEGLASRERRNRSRARWMN